MPRYVRRPSPTFVLSVVYSTALPFSALSVIFDDSSPKGGAKTCHPPSLTLERSCLSLRERWQRAALTERGRGGRRPASPQADPASRLPASRATPRRIKTQSLSSTGRPEAVPYIYALEGIQHVVASA